LGCCLRLRSGSSDMYAAALCLREHLLLILFH
jgi:hypothetical protein